MTLKEKFNSLVPKEFGDMQEPTLTGCEQIKDDYAIHFLFWYKKSGFYELSINQYQREYDNNLYTIKELLQIFKKENGYV